MLRILWQLNGFQRLFDSTTGHAFVALHEALHAVGQDVQSGEVASDASVGVGAAAEDGFLGKEALLSGRSQQVDRVDVSLKISRMNGSVPLVVFHGRSSVSW